MKDIATTINADGNSEYPAGSVSCDQPFTQARAMEEADCDSMIAALELPGAPIADDEIAVHLATLKSHYGIN